MAIITLRNGRKIEDFTKPYIVAEMGTNHAGSMEKVFQMIDSAKEAGCDCVKFQSWSSESLYSKIVYQNNPIAKRMVDKFALGENELLEACEYCKKAGIDFSSTPYSNEEVDFLVDKCQAPYVKVASMDLNNYPFLEYIAKKNVPIILATGMSEMDEIEKAVETIEKTGNRNVCLLHCISIYPPQMSTIHLNNILGLRERFPDYPIGLSDHSLGTEIASASIVMGTALIEKHLTLDKKRMGWDNDMAMEPQEMKQMIEACANVFEALGSKERIVGEAETEQRNKIRRSIVAKRDLEEGTIIGKGDIDVKRPGTGLPPEMMKQIIGKKLNRKIGYDELILGEDLS